ncbi:Stealth CR1 domain-containing protein [Streptococcus sp. 10F2]
MTQEKIDFVVTWVDGSDPVWLERKKTCLQEKFGIELDSSKKSGEFFRDRGFLCERIIGIYTGLCCVLRKHNYINS